MTPLAASLPYPDYGYIDYLETSANSNYNSLQTHCGFATFMVSNRPSLYKDSAINERLKMQIHADFFNVVNHPNFTNPFLPTFFAACDANGINPNTGACQGYLPTTATGDVGEGNPFIGGGGPRGIQLAMKFMF